MSEVWRTDLATIEKMVLLVIADHASDDGTEAWPSQATIAAKASVSIRTVQRAVNSLVENGYLWMQKGAGGSATCREDRRPHKYTINIKRLRGDNETTREERGDNESDNGATLATPTGRLSRPMNHPNKPSKETPDEFIRGKDDFDMFWNSYPLKVGKAAAKRAWEKAITIEKPDVIIMGAYRYALDPNRHPSFTAHASTWLNAGRWSDAPLPPRMLSPEEKRLQEMEESKAKTERERQAYSDWQEELRKTQERAVPIPAELKDLLRKTLPKR
jgi:hypothetical protein